MEKMNVPMKKQNFINLKSASCEKVYTFKSQYVGSKAQNLKAFVLP